MRKHRQAGSKGSALGGSRAEPWPYFLPGFPGAGNGHEVYRALFRSWPFRPVLASRAGRHRYGSPMHCWPRVSHSSASMHAMQSGLVRTARQIRPPPRAWAGRVGSCRLVQGTIVVLPVGSSLLIDHHFLLLVEAMIQSLVAAPTARAARNLARSCRWPFQAESARHGWPCAYTRKIVTALAQDQCGSPPQPPDGFSWRCAIRRVRSLLHLGRMDPVENACRAAVAVLELENQVLIKRIDLPGIPFGLNYFSDRVARTAGW